ncbi:phospholipid phosphatase 2 isoform X3 [Mustela erminea]|uniref:phospholipid phosphatase 2 isoform X3 n=1 Tax=Mustela erminea TaxID=36723 RepID=UPI001386A424|nr:phospholipid phosphatase 2 isoform X3 [Mustela erminea]
MPRFPGTPGFAALGVEKSLALKPGHSRFGALPNPEVSDVSSPWVRRGLGTRPAGSALPRAPPECAWGPSSLLATRPSRTQPARSAGAPWTAVPRPPPPARGGGAPGADEPSRLQTRVGSPAVPRTHPSPRSSRLAAAGAESAPCPPAAPPPPRRSPAFPSTPRPAPPWQSLAPRPCDPAAGPGRDGTRWDRRRGSRARPGAGAGAAWSGGGSSCCSTCCACWSVSAGEAYLVYTDRLHSHSDFNTYVAAIYKVLGTFLFGAAVSQSLTDLAKYTVGRLRPNFLAVCDPDWSRVNCSVYVQAERVCRGSPANVTESRERQRESA